MTAADDPRKQGASVGAALSPLCSGWLRLRYRLEDGLFCAAAWIFGHLPIETSSDLMGRLWRLVAPHLKRHPRAIANLRLAFPTKSAAELEAIARDMWANLGMVLGESFHLAAIVASGRVVVENLDEVRDLSKSAKGCVLCAAHFGNWEIVAASTLGAGFKLAGVYQEIHNPLIDRRVFAMRAFLYPGGLFPKGPEAARSMMRYAGRRGSVAFLADRRDDGGIPVSFFGRTAPSTPFPALIARRFGMPLLAFRVIRESGVRFRVRMHRIEVPVTEDRDDDIKVATARLQAEIESWITERPEQWTWAHRRWTAGG